MELEATLRQIVDAAVNLVGARYGALAVLGGGGMFDRFVHQGIDSATLDALGPVPTGYGLLGVAVELQGALRLTELSGLLRRWDFRRIIRRCEASAGCRVWTQARQRKSRWSGISS